MTWYSEFPCSLDNCAKSLHAQGLCQMHYRRFRIHGTTDDSLGRRQTPEVCTIDGCSSPHVSKDFCNKHYTRFIKYGDPNGGVWHRGEVISYAGVHVQVQRVKGKASGYSCVSCAEPASEWAYDHDDPNELRSAKGMPYSTSVDHYVPLCRPCHRRLDHPKARTVVTVR